MTIALVETAPVKSGALVTDAVVLMGLVFLAPVVIILLGLPVVLVARLVIALAERLLP